MSSNKKKLKLNTVSVNLGCSRSCIRPKLSSLFHPKPKPHHHHYHHPKPPIHPKPTPLSYSSSSPHYTTTSTFSPDTDSDIKSLKAVQGFGRIGGDSLAVEKESDDPYLDFRRSMLQMILEKEIYSKNDLKELLNCFLQLNSPYHHGIIVRAFTEIWNGVYSVHGGAQWTSRHF